MSVLIKQRTILVAVLLFLIRFTLHTQPMSVPEVPSRLELLGMDVRIQESARKEIQEDVNALCASQRYFNIKLERIQFYFPVITALLKDEGVPEDFKFLVIQESALISDAVSSSNAVGFWQFKIEAGKEVGLRIDQQVDERLNIVSSTRGAAKYLKRNNFYFNNWLYALLAYNTGRGGAESFIDEKEFGANRMNIDKKTHWYIKKFIAHKVAFEPFLNEAPLGEKEALIFMDGEGQSLRSIARQYQVETDELMQYNKWLKTGSLPTDKKYAVTIPVPLGTASGPVIVARNNDKALSKEDKGTQKAYPDLFPMDQNSAVKVEINGLPAIKASEGDTWASLAEKGGIRENWILQYNDVLAYEKPIPDQFYYLKPKRNRARIMYHTVRAGESLWQVSQAYAVKVKQLQKKNRMKSGEKLQPGRLLWLSKRRPKNVPVEYKERDSTEKKEVTKELSDAEKEKIRERLLAQQRKLEEEGERQERFVPDPPFSSQENKDRIEKQKAAPEVIVEEDETGEDQVIESSGEVQGEAIEEDLAESMDNESDSNGLEREEETELLEPQQDIYPGTQANRREEEKPLAPQQVKQNQGFVLHEVKKGETLYSIARAYQISMARLLEANDLSVDVSLKEGQQLKIPAAKEERTVEKINSSENSEKASKYYTVKAGDTLYKIARDHNVSLEELMKINDKSDYQLKKGEKLKLPMD